jgi:hypothetical protein
MKSNLCSLSQKNQFPRGLRSQRIHGLVALLQPEPANPSRSKSGCCGRGIQSLDHASYLLDITAQLAAFHITQPRSSMVHARRQLVFGG